MGHRASEPFWDLIMEYRPNRDERYLIKRLAEDWGSPSIVVPHARLTASCVAVRTHVLHHQLLIELLHVADAVIVSFFLSIFRVSSPEELRQEPQGCYSCYLYRSSRRLHDSNEG